jgi:nucleoside-diphosphate-sugar epimerase
METPFMQLPKTSGAIAAAGELAREAATEEERFARCFGANRRVLLLGGGGYIGSPVASHLLRSGMKVRNLDAFVYPTQGSVSGLLLDPGYELMIGDFGDRETLASALEGVTDVVLLGGLVGDPITKSYPELSQRINGDAVLRALEQLSRQDLNKVVFITTCSNYGLMEDGRLATEDSELRPLSLYAEAKVAAERAFFELAGWKGCPTVLRFATAFGAAPRTRFDLTVNEFTRELFVDNELVVFDAETWRPYCHVRDFARLIHMVLAADPDRVRGAVFNAGGDVNNHTKQSIVEMILARLPGRRVSYKEVGSDPRNYRVDFSRVRTVLGFEPQWSVEDGVDELIAQLGSGFFNDFDANRDFYGNYSVDKARLST